ncbi:ATP-binding cassette domain-containing protein [Hugenholtzia roseola]|uniref:ATP-binding cassette domain-containing protein n=1 Tax=Hugenholtzia roseola TaxID=1002 RepID=UPI0003F6978A|nr:ATP-binding cassette domain-containing protein [Hugenholtzia roseola]
MSEDILKALTQLFAIISKQDVGVSEAEREFVIGFFEKELDKQTVSEYVQLYDHYAKYGVEVASKKDKEGEKEKKSRNVNVLESVKTLKICKEINKTLDQKQKVIILFKLLEMLVTDGNFSKQRMEIIDTVSKVFNIPKEEYPLIESFVKSKTSAEMEDSELYLVFDEERPPEGSKKRYLDSGYLDGEIIFIRVKSVELYFMRYLGNDDIYLNGQLVKRNGILLFSHGSVIKTPKGAPLYYSDLVTRFNDTEIKNRISFAVNHLEFRFPDGTIGLRDINFAEGPGKLISIMGASGAGKTTLLNVLAGLEEPYKGEVLINGFNIHKEKDKIEGVIGYIAQDDLLIEELTVYQNLYYNAKLCFKDMPEKELHERVMDVLASLGLDRISHIQVGNVLNKMISGGQRKRLNIALELIREPAIMFVDEPTSGLSSRDSENVIDLLKELSLKGKLIFVVIHQPSSDIYKMFDKMILLDTGGYPIFYGNPVDAITYFKRATNQVGSDEGQCPTCGTVQPELLFNIIEARVVNEYGEYTNKRKITPPEWNDLYKQTHKIEPIETVKETPPNSLNIPSKLQQTVIFTIRDFLSKISNRQYLAINLLEAPLLALLLALVVRFKNAKGIDEYIFRYNDNVPAYILIAIIVALFMGLTVSAEEIIRDRKIQKRESFLNLSRGSYLFSKITILFSLSAIQTLSFALIGNFILEVQGMYFVYWVVLFTVSCFANMLGLNISASFNSAVTVYIIIPLLLIPQMILSGAIFRFDQLNNSIVEKGRVPVIADIMASRWAYEAIAVEQFKSNPYEKHFFEVEMEISRNSHRMNFWIPKLQEIIDRVITHKKNPQNDSITALIQKDLALIAYEVKSEGVSNLIKEYSEGKLDLEKALSEVDIDEKTGELFKAVLEQIRKQDYNSAFVRATETKDSIVNVLEQNPDNKLDVNAMQNSFHNDALASQVKNEMIKDRYVEGVDALVQQTDPIFYLPAHVRGWWDYRTHFFAPRKHFAGNLYNTLAFNLSVIWLMSFLLYLTLYFEVLKKAFSLLGALPSFFKKKKK